jgi:hypothetical protein
MARNVRFILFLTAVLVVWAIPVGLLFVAWIALWGDAPPRGVVVGTTVVSAGLALRFALWLWLRMPMCGEQPAQIAADAFFRGP